MSWMLETAGAAVGRRRPTSSGIVQTMERVIPLCHLFILQVFIEHLICAGHEPMRG